MADIMITGEMAERLQELAQRSNRAVEDILRDALDRYLQYESSTSEPRPSFAEMARIARENPIEVGDPSVSERSREILQNEYAEYLLKRLRDGDVDE